MTNINDFEKRINAAETIIGELRANIDTLRVGLHYLKNQQPEPEQEPLFGRWATHPTFGRGIIASRKPDGEGEVRFAYRNSSYTDGAETRFARPESLTLDPATLNTTEDFEKAPVGTIVEATEYPHDVAVKNEDGWYRTGGMHAIAVEYMPTCRVIRWGENK